MTARLAARPAVLDRLGEIGIVPVLTVRDPDVAEPLAAALVDGGLPFAEVTLRTSAALAALRRMAAVPGMYVGAGTVTTAEQADAVADAGAHFAVSPGWSDGVVARCADRGLALLPGTATASDVMRALDHGIETVKFFPAESSGGTAAVTALAAPFPQVRFVPTGGIGEQQLASYVRLPSVLAVGGSWLAPPALVEAGNWREITRLAAAAVTAVADEREGGHRERS